MRALPWIIALIVSLAANGVMTGIVLSTVLTAQPVYIEQNNPPSPRGDGEVRGPGGFNVRGFLRALPPEMREQARSRFEAEREDLRELVRAGAEAQRDVVRAVTAEPYDPARVSEAMSEMRVRRGEVERAFEGIVLEIVADLPPNERARALGAGSRRGPPEHRRPPRDRF